MGHSLGVAQKRKNVDLIKNWKKKVLVAIESGVGKQTTSVSVSSGILVYIYM